MNSIGMKTFGILAAAAACSHAIFGIGGQYAPALGLQVKGETAVVTPAAAPTAISVDQAGVSGLTGFGLKLWVDFLPFVDIEAGTNMQFGQYDLAVVSGTTRIPVEAELDLPFVEAKPTFARIVSEASVLYPFLKLPPVISLVKLYAGAGITHVLATEVVNAKFAKQAVDKAIDENGAASADDPNEIAALLGDALVEEGLMSGVGFHLMVGAKAKPPIVPVAVFANFKYHFLGAQPDPVDANSLTLELGGALAF